MKTIALPFKRAFLPVLFTLLLCVAEVTNAIAQEFTVGNLNYSVNDDGVSVTVTGHVDGEGATGTLTIPESVSYEGIVYPVTTIGESAFIFCNGLTGSLTIPNSVTTIGYEAFAYCSGFTGNLVIPNSVISIGSYYNEEYNENWEHWSYAFYGCSGFNGTLTVSNSLVEIGDGAFEGCSSLTGDLVIPNSVTTIGSSAFSGCSGFNGTLTLGNSVTTICEYAFYGCSGFTGDLVIPNSVTVLGGYYYAEDFNNYGDSHVFAGCSGFNGTLTLGSSLTDIGSGAFYGCSGFTGDLVIPNSLQNLSYWGYSIDENDGAFEGCSGFTGNLTIIGATSIGANSFSGCSGFTGTLSLGNFIWDIGDNAFEGCDGFSSIIMLGDPWDVEVSQSAFTGVNTDIPVYVSCGILEHFIADPVWSNFSNIQEPQYPYLSTIVGVADPVTAGTISGSGIFGGSTRLCVTPNEGYTFQYWTIGMGNAYIEDELWHSCIGIEGYGSHVFMVAHFEPLPTGPITINVEANPAEGGTVSGGGEYEYGVECTVTAAPNEGYTFVNWIENGNHVSFDASYSFTVTGDRNLVANFIGEDGCVITIDLYDWSSYGWHGNQLMVTDDSGNSFELTLEDGLSGTRILMFVNGSHVTLTWIEDYWSSDCYFTVSYLNGNVIYEGFNLSGGFLYEFDVDCEQIFDITATANPAEGGTVSGGGEYDYGAECTLIATPNDGYTFMNWTENGEVVSTEATYSFTVTEDATYVANFALPFTITATANPAEGGTVTGSGIYDYGTTCILTATANEGHGFMRWTENGQIVSTDATYTFTVTADRNLVANFSDGGCLPGVFSVSDSKRVGFSIGNLQYQATTNIWRFAENQWDYVGTQFPDPYGNYGGTVSGSDNTNISQYYYGWIDLFGWGTSGYNHGSNAYQPWSTSLETSDYYVYGDFNNNLCDQTGQADWGYNAIINGGNAENSGWQTLTHSEWDYLFNTRNTASGIRWTQGSVNGVNGVILLPDNWTSSIYTLNNANGGDYSSNTVTASDWTNILEANGAVFLPAAGTRGGESVRYVGNTGSYWSSSYSDSWGIYVIYFYNGYFSSDWTSNRAYGRPVRLVRPTENESYNINATPNPVEGGTVSGVGEYDYGATCTLMALANEGYSFINWTENGTVVSMDATYSFIVTNNRNLVANFVEGDLCAITFDLYDSYGDGYTGNYLVVSYGNVIEQLTVENGSFASHTLVIPDGSHVELSWIIGSYLEDCSFSVSYSGGEVIYEGSNLDSDFSYEFDVNCNGSSNITQTSTFSQGYNWWCSYVEQEGIDGLSMLQEALGDNGVTIRSQASGYNDYYDGYGWFGSLSSINNESSYRVITSAPCSVTLSGIEAVPSQHPITLSQGWKWIGYVPSTAMDVNVALAGLTPTSGDKLKSQQGYADYYENYGWYGSLNTIEPGMGLMYYSANGETVTFTYPDGNRGGALKKNLTAENNHWKPNVHAYPDNMTMMSVVELDDTELSSDNYELAAFANDECRGSAKLTYAEPLHRHVAFLTVSGKDAAELSFRLYDTKTGMEYYDAEESLSFVANAIVGEADDLYTFHFRGTTGMDEFASKVKIYPNPVAPGERFSIGMNGDVTEPIRLEIINTLGVVETVCIPSHQTLTAPKVAGVYTLRITVEGKETVICKLIVK